MTPEPAVLETGICGVTLRALHVHGDERGSVTEIFRSAWGTMPVAVQWNCVRSGAGVLRGVHAHVRHTDYLVVVEGSMAVGLKDVRPGSASRNTAVRILLDAAHMQVLVIPPGVAHGFYFPKTATLVQAVSEYFDPTDELGCRWDDPALGIQWASVPTAVSGRDAALPAFSVFAQQMEDALR